MPVLLHGSLVGECNIRRQFYILSAVAVLAVALLGLLDPLFLILYFGVLPAVVLGIWDTIQTRQTIRRNFPVIGHFRYFFELIRPEINQYFVESNSDGVPFSREQRSIVYQRAKKELDTLPFGTQRNIYEPGYEWVTHSLVPRHIDPNDLYVDIGGPRCAKPYRSKILNVSAMSFGSLSKNAVMALNRGAKLGGFAHNTGEGGLSEYHLQGGDLTWQIGTGYFSCRSLDGRFSETAFRERAVLPSVKMIEIKLSQGAKPSHGGILPGKKVSEEIAGIRGVVVGKDVISPPAHSAFSTPEELLLFIEKLRTLSEGKPIGMKMCLGKRREFMALCKAMVKYQITPDFITVDGGEGGTGAAPLEFSNFVGYPLKDALAFVHNALVGFNLRTHIRLIASGRVVTGFDLISKFALGADLCNSARAMMMALGCIQALRCNSNQCPTGVATQDPELIKGLDVSDKSVRVFNFHRETVKGTAEIMGAMGLTHSNEVRPWHVFRRTGITEAKHYGEIYEFIEKGSLLKEPYPKAYERSVKGSTAESFKHV